MSNYKNYGTLTANGSGDWVSVCGWATLICTGTWDTATMTWKVMAADGNEVSIFGGSDNITEQAYTADHMVNVFFGDDVSVRGTVSSVGGSTDLDWQIIGNPNNRSR